MSSGWAKVLFVSLKIIERGALPVIIALLLFSIFSRIFIEIGSPNCFLIWLACGVPFGIGKMFTLIPMGFGISGTVGVVALNIILGGLIGGVSYAYFFQYDIGVVNNDWGTIRIINENGDAVSVS